MNCITKSLNEVMYRIPGQILREVFTDKLYRWRDAPISIDEQITNKVIRPRVLVDCNLVGGTEAFIPVEGLELEMIDNFTTVYHIPKDRTQGRSIMSVLSVSFTSHAFGQAAGGLSGISPNSVTPTLSAGMAMMDSFSPIPLTSTARVQLIAENTVMVKDTSPVISSSYIRCVLANDDNMAHIQMRAIPPFCKLVELATKSYIYNESIIKIDMAKLSGGQDLGKFKEIVETYADSEELYQEYLAKTWTGIAFMNDRETFTRFIKLGIGGMR